jgi:hypothetical protein
MALTNGLTAIAGTTDGVQAFDPKTLRSKWTHLEQHSIQSLTKVSPQLTAVSAKDGSLYTITINQDRPRATLISEKARPDVTSGDGIFAFSTKEAIHIYNSKTGERETRIFPKERVITAPTLYKSLLYIVLETGIASFDTHTGEKLWKNSEEKRSISSVSTSPAVTDSMVAYMETPNHSNFFVDATVNSKTGDSPNYLFFLDRISGEYKTKIEYEKGVSSPPISGKGTFFVQTPEGVYAHPQNRPEAKIHFYKLPHDHPLEDSPTHAVIGDSYISSRTSPYSIDIDSLSLNWTADYPGKLIPSESSSSKEILYVTEKGAKRAWCIDLNSGDLAYSVIHNSTLKFDLHACATTQVEIFNPDHQGQLSKRGISAPSQPEPKN